MFDDLSWEEFREQRRTGAVLLGIHQQTARRIMADRAMRPANRAVFYADIIWRTIGLAIIAAGLVLAITWHWWAVLIGLAVGPMIYKSADTALRENLLAEAESDPAFYTRVRDAEGWLYAPGTGR